MTNFHLHRRLSGCTLTTNLPQFVCKYLISQYSHIPVYMLATLIASMLTGVMMPRVQMRNAWFHGQIPSILFYSITQRMPPASILAIGIHIPTHILHPLVSTRTVVYPTDKSYKSSQGLNIDPRLLFHPGLLVLYQASL